MIRRIFEKSFAIYNYVKNEMIYDLLILNYNF
jgi:hypothetical protein